MHMQAPLPPFLDTEALNQACARACDEGPAKIANYQHFLRLLGETLAQAFADGEPVASLILSRSQMIDRVLTTAWKQFGLDQDAIALIAVGGYGRQELHPGSDIDVLILLECAQEPAAQEPIGTFLSFLWDIGLEIGHSVRTLDECLEEATRDITVITNLMEARELIDSQSLLQRLNTRIGPQQIWDDRAFFEAKLKERAQRYSKFGETAYRVEPNLKDGPGGLRDIQMIAWVTHRHFGTPALSTLVDQGYLTEREFEALMEGQDFLWRLRFALHLVANKKEDRLLFDYQRALAQRFGYEDGPNNLAVEQFMQRYYRTVMELERLNEILLQFFSEALIYADEGSETVSISAYFQTRRGFLETVDDQVFLRYPPALLEVFLTLQLHPQCKGIRASTIRLIRNNGHLIDDAFRANPICRALFMQILRQPQGITDQLRRMNRYGILAAYIPAFGKIVGRMQYDLFHAYTVDEHTLFVVRNLRRFSVSEFAHEFPACSRVFQTLKRPEILYLAGLFHDIAKGRGGDHSELGALDALTFCTEHGVGKSDANLVAWLVRNHLLMSMTAQRLDISDPQILNTFAQQVGSAARLDHLYLLSVADVRGTNPTLWNSWKDALFSQLYNATLRVLQRGLDNPLDKNELIDEVKDEAEERLEEDGVDTATAHAIWANFDDHYFLRHSADEVAWYTRAIDDVSPDDMPLVLLRRLTRRGSTEIFIYSIDFPQLFSLTTEVLDQLGLTIVDARILTSKNGYALNTFLILEEDGKAIDETYRVQEITGTVKQRLEQPHKALHLPRRRLPRQLKHFSVPTKIVFSDDQQRRWTVMELITADRPGLLSRVGKALLDCGIRIHHAKIATVSERADDMFHITDMQHRPVSDETRREEIRQSITQALDQNS